MPILQSLKNKKIYILEKLYFLFVQRINLCIIGRHIMIKVWYMTCHSKIIHDVDLNNTVKYIFISHQYICTSDKKTTSWIMLEWHVMYHTFIIMCLPIHKSILYTNRKYNFSKYIFLIFKRLQNCHFMSYKWAQLILLWLYTTTTIHFQQRYSH